MAFEMRATETYPRVVREGGVNGREYREVLTLRGGVVIEWCIGADAMDQKCWVPVNAVMPVPDLRQVIEWCEHGAHQRIQGKA